MRISLNPSKDALMGWDLRDARTLDVRDLRLLIELDRIKRLL